MITSLRTALLLPPVPSFTAIYKSTQTDTANADTSTFTFSDIGVPHPKRVVVLSIYRGVGNGGQVTGTVNGIGPISEDNSSATVVQTSILVFQVPTDTAAFVSVTSAGSARKAVALSIFYPASPILLTPSSATTHDQATTTTDAVVSTAVQAGGALFYAGAQPATLGAFGTTWSGVDAVIEDVDAQLEATASYTMGHINITATSQGSLTMAETVSGTKYLNVLALGPAYGYR